MFKDLFGKSLRREKKEIEELTKRNNAHEKETKDKTTMAVNPYEHNHRENIKKDMLAPF